jgi:hypothetical protein
MSLWLMSVELHRPPKPEECQKNSKDFNEKKPYFTRDSNPEPVGSQSVVLTTAPLGRLNILLGVKKVKIIPKNPKMVILNLYK